MNLHEFSHVLGVEHVITGAEQRARAELATFPASHHVPAILRPASTKEVQECVRIARSQRVTLFPISRGRNWGYGSAVPFADNCLVLDLRRMNRILDYNDKLGYVVVEPGVTQDQLAAFLEERGGRFWMDSSGSAADASPLGNTLERGFGHTPYGDHFANSCCLEVVLPTGERIETGLGAFETAKAKHVHRWGVGPSLDGLFTQSRLGIVTRMTIWLMPAPEAFEAFFLKCSSPQDLPALINALREVRMAGILQSSIHVVNGYRVLAGIQQYPWDATGGSTPLRPEFLQQFIDDLGFGHWNASGGIYGPAPIVKETKKLLKAALKDKVASIRFVNQRTLSIAKRYAGVISPLIGLDLKRTLGLLEPAFALLKGLPSNHAMRSVYWRKRVAVPPVIDPDVDRCGLLWTAPVAPADGASATEIASIAQQTMLEAGFEPLLSLTLATPRSLIGVISIIYDRDVEGEDNRAMACNRQLNQRLGAAGYQPYRLGLQSMSTWEGRRYSPTLRTLQSALDPDGILSPGHYDLSQTRP